jgi:vesicle transport through interaction with t-SNAREs protein 1
VSLQVAGYFSISSITMSIFDAYDSEFNTLTREINKTVADFKVSTGKKDVQTRQIDGLLSQATELIKQMEVEVRSQDAATRKALTEKVAQYKRALNSLKSDYNTAREQADRSNLIGGKSGEQRQRLLDTNEK